MCCITLTSLETTMATKQLTPDVNQEIRTPWLPQNLEQRPVRMNWAVVTEDDGTQQVRMNWDHAASDD